MRKKHTLGLALALISLGLVGCSTANNESTNSTATPTSEVIPSNPTTESSEEIKVNKYSVTINLPKGNDKFDIDENTVVSYTPESITGYKYVGLYVDSEYKTLYDNSGIKGNIELYAKYDKLEVKSYVVSTNLTSAELTFEDNTKTNITLPSSLDDYVTDKVEPNYLKEGSATYKIYNEEFDVNIEFDVVLEKLELEALTKNNTIGFADGVTDFRQYEGSEAYVKVTTAKEFVSALIKARTDYTSEWVYEPSTDEEKEKCARYWELEDKRQNNTITSAEKTERTALENEMKEWPGHLEQTLNAKGTVHVIEIAADLELGYNTLKSVLSAEELRYVDDFSAKQATVLSNKSMYASDMLLQYGISQIKIENSNDLLIYSKNGAKLTHAGFKLNSDNNIVFRNLEMDEIWQWEDSKMETPNYTIGDYDLFGWAYMKIGFSSNIWVDHCTFGKSFDGQIDVSNPYFYTRQTAFRAPYGSPEYYSNKIGGVHISNCTFNSGSDDKDGYLYKMMASIEDEYQVYKTQGADYVVNDKTCLYYFKLRDLGATFDDMLYAIAIPQKKGFLLGDSGDYFDYNIHLKVSFDCCTFKNIEDRLPKIRGGLVCVYNSIIDQTEYQTAKSTMASHGVYKATVSAISSKYKYGGVSQGILCGLGGSVYIEGCIYRAVSEPVKNNDSSVPKAYYNDTVTTTAGTYCVVRSVLETVGSTATPAEKSTGTNSVWDNMSTSSITSKSESEFGWGYDFDSKPINMKVWGALAFGRTYKGLETKIPELKLGAIKEDNTYNWLFNDYII